MELWEKVIVEWINCLEVQEKPVKSITELQNGVFYINFLKLIKWKKLENFEQEDIIKFIGEEYPTFKVNKDDNSEHIFIASLLLLHLCRTLFAIHHSLQYMCDNLRNETQIRVKAFLESVLPIGKEITKETMREVIMEVEDMSTAADIRKTPPVEDFSNSPLTRSGRSKKILTERVREMRDLRCSLAIERFTNADLRDDILRQHNKIKKLQKKLDEKSTKIKELQEERLKPSTPLPSHTKENNSQEDYYKRYINDLENQLSKQQDEINKLEAEKDAISKELCCTRRTSKHYKENFANCERSLESISNKIELKDRELIELRMHNEELRAHIKEFNKNAHPEQSFEVEDVSFHVAKSLNTSEVVTLNTSEVLSSVIEIQLQEAKEESAILHAQVDSLKGRMYILTKDYRSVMESNRDLQEKVKMLDRVQAELNHIQMELDVSNTTVAGLQVEKVSLVTQTEDLKSLLLFREKRLSEIEQSNVALSTELDNLKRDIKNLNELLENEKTNSSNLSSTLAETNSQVTEHLACIHELTDERDSYKSSIENYSKSLRDILHCNNQFIQVEIDNLNNSTFGDLTKYIEAMLYNCNVMRVSYESDIEKLNTTINEINANLLKQQIIITTLEEQNNQTMMELGIIKEEKKQKDLLLNEQKEVINIYSQEIEVLKKIRDEKFVLEQNVYELTNNLAVIKEEKNQKDLLLNEQKEIINSYSQEIEVLKKIRNEKSVLEQNVHELTNNLAVIKEEKNQKDLLLNEQNEIINTYSQEIEVLKEIRDEKFVLEQNVHELTNNLVVIKEEKKKKDLLLNEQKEVINTYSQEIEVLKEIRNEKFVLEQNVYELTNNLAVIKEEKNQKDLLLNEQKEVINIYSQEIEILKEIRNEKFVLEQNVHELTNNLAVIKEEKNQKDLLLNEQKEIINSYSQEIEVLKEIRNEKFVLEQNVHELTNNLAVIKEEKNQKDLLLNEQKEIINSYSQEIEDLKEIRDEKFVLEQNVHELTNNLAVIKEEKKQKDLLLNEQKEVINTYSQEIEVLKEIRDEKFVLEQNVHELTNNLTNRELLLKYVMIQLKDLQDINKDFKLLKEETQQNFGECKKNMKLTFEKLQYEYHMLNHNYHKVRREKEKLEYNFNYNKEELTKIQTINITLQQNLLENEEKIGALEEKKRLLFDELNESKRHIQELKDTNQVLQELHAIMETETNDKLESLKSDNAKILLELKDATDKLNLLHQEMSDITTQMELKEAQINELLSNISVLKTEKDDLMCFHKKTLEAKDKEIEMKEEALLTLQIKMDKVASEANTTEKKMKEIIINLQEIRSSQDAVLTTQEAALKEKCRYIEELQKRFDNSKEILNKELEDAKSSLSKYQIQFFDLENQFNNQNKTIAELQDMIKTMRAELETNKEYCKHMDASQAEIVKLCQELEYPTKNLNSTITETCSDFDLHDIPQCINIENKYKCINIDNNVNILNIIKMTLDELHKSQKIILHLSCVNTELNETLTKQKVLIDNNEKDKEEICSLKNKIQELEIIAQKRNNYLKSLIKNKESLKDSLQKVFATRNDLDTILISSKQKWNEILTKFQNIFYTENSVCDEFKQLQIKKTNLENILLKCQVDYSENIKSICDILWEKFLWTEQKLHDTYLCSIHEKECLDILWTNVEEDQFSTEKMVIDVEFEKYKALQIDVIKSEEEIESFTTLATCYDNSLKSGEIKNQVEIEKKLQNQINQLTKEKKDLKTKMDTMRLRNVKLEKNIDDLRTEVKKLKSTETVPTEEANLTMSEGAEVQFLRKELEHLKEQNQQLHEEKDESNKIAKQKFENQLKEIHATYEQKLEDMKQKMKTAYNEQMTKLNKDQEKILQEKLQNQMEVMCQRQREELNRYKAHVGELSSQLWSVGEKLLIEQQQKQDTLQRVKELETKVKEFQADQPMATISRKTCRMEKQEMLPENAQQTQHKITTLITEETLERRHSIRSIQAMGNVFKTEDEEEIFDNVYLADMKRGNFMPITDTNRLSVLQMRNSLCKPHLKSSYAAEMQFLPSTLTEEEIKTGSSEDNFNDSLSQSLLPEQKARKKDRTQISYKKPGPPTPSKNGGRLSLQGNELKSPSSRILRERNVDRRTTTTPHSLKNIFSLKRQDENTTGTPKGRRLSSLFRKSRLQSDR